MNKSQALLPIVVIISLLALSVSAENTTTTTTAAAATTTTYAPDTEAFKISPPDIYPFNSTLEYHGEVQIRMVANQPHSDIYYTTDGSLPVSDTRAGSTSKLYSSPFSIFKPGTWLVQAIAFPRFKPMLDSRVRSTYVKVIPSEVPPPTVFPPRGQYRSSVNIEIRPGEGEDKFPGEPRKYQFTIDFEDPGDTWQAFDPAQGILIDTPGVHRVFVRTVVGNGKDGRTSPAGRYTYTITPALLYDVSSECPKCANFEPVVGQWFTVFIQNAATGAKLWLTTSSKGCEKRDAGRHLLDDTTDRDIEEGKAFYRFLTKGDPQPKVFVCLNESVSKVNPRLINTVDVEPKNPATAPVPFSATKVPRRAKAGDGAITDGSFAVDAATGAIDPNIAGYKPPTKAPVAGGPNIGSAGDLGYSAPVRFDSGSVFSMITFVLLFMVVALGIVGISRMMSMRDASARAERAERASIARVEMEPKPRSALPV